MMMIAVKRMEASTFIAVYSGRSKRIRKFMSAFFGSAGLVKSMISSDW